MSIIEEYRKSLKMTEAEELLDLVLYRPLGLLLVKAIYRFPITPNQVTLLSLVSGLVSAFCFAAGTASGFVWGGVWYMVANVLDCSDGQLARLQNSGTPLGRLVDGIVDWVISTAIFTGLGFGLAAYTGNPAVWYLAIAGGLTSAFHAVMFDGYQQQFISRSRGEPDFLVREMARIQMELQTTPSSSPLRRFALRTYLAYMGLQGKSSGGGMEQRYPPELFRSKNMKLMRWYTFIGATTNRSLLIAASFFSSPEVFLWVVITAGNMWLVVALMWKRRVQRNLDLAMRTEPVPSSAGVAANA
jgi:phosphatidylglycerophosphate synthase